MSEVLWIALPFIVSLGSGVLAYIVAQARTEAANTSERQGLVEMRAQLRQQQKIMEEKIRAIEAEARRNALEEFLADVRVEERHFVRQIGSPTEHQRSLVVQERVCFRNIPLSPWTERELPFEQEIERPKPIAMPALEPRRRLLR